MGRDGGAVRAQGVELSATFLDQLLLSGQSFLIGALFVALATKTEYGAYLLLASALLLVTSAHNALICTPFTSVVSRLEGYERTRARDGFFLLQLQASAVLAALFAAGTWILTAGQRHPDPLLAFAIGLAVLGTCARDFRRTEYFLGEDLRGLLFTDTLYVATGLLLLGAGAWMGHGLGAALALAAVGAAGLLTGLRRTTRDRDDVLGLRLASRAWTLARDQARWTFPWTLVSWCQNSSYPYLIALAASAAAVADAGAARLILMPVTLFSVGWNRLFFARAGRHLGRGSRGQVWTLAVRGAALLGAIVLLYGIAALLLASFRSGALLPVSYRHLSGLVLAWSLYFLVTTVRGVGSAALLAHQEARRLFRISAFAAAVSLPVALLLGRAVGPGGLIAGIAGGEAVIAVSVWSTLAGFERGELAPEEALAERRNPWAA